MSDPGPHALLSLHGHRALVTGAGGGIGRAICATLLDAGAEVTAVDLPGHRSVPGVLERPCDLTDSAAIAALAGEPDLLVHAAGITRDGMLWKLAPDDWRVVQAVNLDAAFHLLQRFVPAMRARGDGRIVMITSINGERGKLGQTNYAASKAGLIGLVRSAAKELGPRGIRVNAVSPGLIETAMTRELPAPVRARALEETALGCLGQPEDVARAVWFLCSELSAHVTGQVLRVDGGQLTS